MQRKKQVHSVAAILLILIFIISLPFSVNAEEELTYSEALAAFKEDMLDPTHIDSVNAAYLYCLTTDSVLLSFDASAETFEAPADTAKLLTALTAYDLIEDLSDTVTITQTMIDESINRKMVEGASNARYGYVRGDKVTYADLLCTLLMRLANDSAVALAYDLCDGDMSAFAEKMNEKAAEIGLTDSHFTNSLGAHDENMYTTANDIFLLANEFYKNETLMGYVGSDHIRLDSGSLVYSRNFLVSKYYNSGKDYRDSSVNGMIVGKGEGGDVIVRSAKYNDYEYICVILGAKRDAHLVYSYEVSGELIKWGSKNHSFINIFDKNRPVSSIAVKSARESDSVPIVPSENFSKYISKDAYETGRLTQDIVLSVKSLKAPVAKGTEVGEILVYYDGELIAQSALVTAHEITENTTSAIIQSVWEAISSKRAITLYIVAVSCVTVYVLINSVIRYRRKIKQTGDGIK